jgi:tRNA pseudouridine55 synthase
MTFGLLNVDKPAGLTSHDVVGWVRRGTHVRKVGHAGTLDPMATGVLVLCLGPATRLSAYIMGHTKRYIADVRLGIETTTYDAEGEVVAECDPSGVTRGAVESALEAFRGEIMQVPPAYSAIKRNGVRLYKLARQGEEIKIEARPVTIESLRLTVWKPPVFRLEVVCSPGTYIRSLAHDIGRVLEVGAHLAGLRRESVGAFTLGDAVTWDALTAAMESGDWERFLLPPERAVIDWPAVPLTPEQVEDVRHGRFIDRVDDTLMVARAHTPDGRLAALLEAQDGRWRPRKVFI